MIEDYSNEEELDDFELSDILYYVERKGYTIVADKYDAEEVMSKHFDELFLVKMLEDMDIHTFEKTAIIISRMINQEQGLILQKALAEHCTYQTSV